MTSDDRRATAIWNRATAADLPMGAREGDRALHDVMEFHGHVMNGGLDHALDVVGDEAQRAALGWQLLGREDVADLIRDALRVVSDMPDDVEARQGFFIDGWTDEQAAAIEELSMRYPDDKALDDALLNCLRQRPDAFAAVA